MKPVKSTAEILAIKILDGQINSRWVKWAIDMLITGYETENLYILAGIDNFKNQIQLKVLMDKIIDELHLDYSDSEQILNNYADFLLEESLKGNIDTFCLFDMIDRLYSGIGRICYINESNSYYWAKKDLLETGEQWYIKGATLGNIDQMIIDYFKEQLKKFLKLREEEDLN